MKDRRVMTESGELEGIWGWDPRVIVFKGVPYAAPPVGDLRWRAPQPVPKWEGIRKADSYGPVACQPVPGGDPEEFWTREIHPTGPEFKMSEDCLYLNVFTPARRGDEKLPVLFYIHGGGYRGGYPYEMEFDWEHMARKGIVVVAVAYRLGVLGFLASPELSGEAPDGPKGNYGLLDQLAALKWTKRNIEAFGGDPDRITIAGQSAGAGSVQFLLTSPMAEGLVSGAIIESTVQTEFADMPAEVNTPEKAEAFGQKFLEAAGIHSLKEARGLSAERMMELEEAVFGPGFHFRPVIDGILIKETAFQAYKNGRYPGVPVIAGYNRGETATFNQRFAKVPSTMEAFETFVAQYGDRADEFKQLCGVSTDAQVKELFSRDAMIGSIAGTRMFGYIRACQGRDTYLYEFDADIPGEDKPGSFHGSEMWFAYDSLARCWRPFTGKHYDLARQVSSYWVNFVKTGDPNGTDTFGNPLPEWKSFTPENQFMMLFEDVPQESERTTDPLMKMRMDLTLKD